MHLLAFLVPLSQIDIDFPWVYASVQKLAAPSLNWTRAMERARSPRRESYYDAEFDRQNFRDKKAKTERVVWTRQGQFIGGTWC